MNFDQSFDKLIGHEGNYIDHPDDPGGETKFGISKRQYPQEDIINLTLERAKVIYKRDYWGPTGCDALPNLIRFDVFDAAVNSGVKQSIKWLQQSVGADDDGIIGPKTLLAVNSNTPGTVLARFNGHRLDMMTDLKTWPVFGRGWVKRIADNLKSA